MLTDFKKIFIENYSFSKTLLEKVFLIDLIKNLNLKINISINE